MNFRFTKLKTIISIIIWIAIWYVMGITIICACGRDCKCNYFNGIFIFLPTFFAIIVYSIWSSWQRNISRKKPKSKSKKVKKRR